MRLQTFGTLALIDDAGGGENRLQRRQLALLAVLAVEGTAGVTRDRLLGLFGGDREPEKARHALDQMLYAARRVLGAEAIISGPVSLRLDGALLPSDVMAFIDALGRGDLRAAGSVYTGPFLHGVFLADAPEFERWTEERRAYYAGAFVQALVGAAAATTAAGDHADAVRLLRRAAANDPLSGAITHALMQALVAHGDQSAALSVARVHGTLVREELDAEPDPRVTALEEELRSGGGRRAPSTASPAPARSPASAPDVAPSVPGAPRRRRLPLVVSAIATAALLAAVAMAMIARGRRTEFVLRDPTQLTATGDSRIPALSPDGRYLAFSTTRCTNDERCASEIDLRELNGSATRRLVENARDIDYIAWSPDARTLLFHGTAGGPAGFYVVSALGGEPLYLPAAFVSFYAGGDSLLLLHEPDGSGFAHVVVAGLNGAAGDSIAMPTSESDGAPEEVYAVAKSPWILVSGFPEDRGVIRVIDRRGREVSRRAFSTKGENLRTSQGAVWAAFPHGLSSMVVRLPFDQRTGALSAEIDTVHIGDFTQFDVSPGGDLFVVDRNTDVHDLWAVRLADAARGDLGAGKRLAQSSMGIDASLSPDGASVIIARAQDAMVNGGFRFSTMPFDSGAERPLAAGDAVSARWAWNGTIAIEQPARDSSRLMLLDPVTGERRGVLSVPVPGIRSFVALSGGGWAWITQDGRAVRALAAGDPAAKVFAKNAWYENLRDVRASPDGKRLVYWGENAARDSVRVTVLSLTDGVRTIWWAARAPEDMIAEWLDDRSLSLRVWERRERVVISTLSAPGRVGATATIPRHTDWVELSADMKRAVVITHIAHGDIWLSRVTKR